MGVKSLWMACLGGKKHAMRVSPKMIFNMGIQQKTGKFVKLW